MSEAARALVAAARMVLLDFDGPVCSIFSGIPAPFVADQLRCRLRESDVELVGAGAASEDPLEVFRAASATSEQAATLTRTLLEQWEEEAAATAVPTPGASEFLEEMHRRATPLAIVSNNGNAGISAYLRREGLDHLVVITSARPAEAGLMKPHPHSLEYALGQLRIPPQEAVMIGDSPSDVVAARAIGSVAIALVNRPDKLTALEAVSPDALITRMAELL